MNTGKEILQLKTAQSSQMLDPSKTPDLNDLQIASDRLKRLAKDYLKNRGTRAANAAKPAHDNPLSKTPA